MRFILFSFLLCGCIVQQKQPRHSINQITGKVQFEGRGVAGVQIVIIPTFAYNFPFMKTTTNERGYFRLSVPQPGTYTILAHQFIGDSVFSGAEEVQIIGKAHITIRLNFFDLSHEISDNSGGIHEVIPEDTPAGRCQYVQCMGFSCLCCGYNAEKQDFEYCQPILAPAVHLTAY